MRKLILTAGICVATLMGVQAQQAATSVVKSTAPAKQDMETKMVTNMTSACSLTQDQVAKVKPIVAEFVKARAENKEKSGGDKDKMKAANQASMKAMNAKLATVLNADQMGKWTAKEKAMQAEMQKKAASGK